MSINYNNNDNNTNDIIAMIMIITLMKINGKQW